MTPAVSIRFKDWLKTKTYKAVVLPQGGTGNAAEAAGIDGGRVCVRSVNRLGWVAKTKDGLLAIDYDEMSDEQAEKMMAGK